MGRYENWTQRISAKLCKVTILNDSWLRRLIQGELTKRK